MVVNVIIFLSVFVWVRNISKFIVIIFIVFLRILIIVGIIILEVL